MKINEVLVPIAHHQDTQVVQSEMMILLCKFRVLRNALVGMLDTDQGEVAKRALEIVGAIK